MHALLGSPWWVLLFAALGLIGVGALVLNLFSGIGERPTRAKLSGDCRVGTTEFLIALAGTLNAPLQRGGSARLLNNGDEFFPVLLDALRAAEHSINFMIYIWEPGEMSDRLFEVLEERARRGVQVRVMVDGIGGMKAPEERIAALRAAGGKWVSFNPPRFGKLTRVHKRNHRRAIIVDGAVGFTGGMSVADQWLGNAENPDHWRDCLVEVRGCLASNLQSAFTQLWVHVTGEMLLGPEFYPPADEAAEAVRGPGEPISHHLAIVSSPSGSAHPMRFLHWFSLRAACERIYITNPYFVPDDLMAAVLVDRVRAGVDVRVLVPNENIDLGLIRWASHNCYETLLEAGVRIYEYQPTMIHQKLVVVDGRWSLVGSANMDVRSKELNQENALGVLDVGFATQLEETFFADLERAREITLEAFRRRPLWHRVPEKIAGLFEEQF